MKRLEQTGRARPAIAAAVLLFLSCGELRSPTDPLGGDPPDPTATFTRVQNEIFTPTCASIGCHDVLGQESSLVLSAGSAYQNTVGVTSVQMPSLRRIEPGSPESSYLYRKLTGAGISGERMPFGKPPLDESNLDLIRDWIRRGAPND
jgi:hypothetical protein